MPEGTVYGFIGPNGSGKTTTLRMILRILYPDRGMVRVLGLDHGAAADDRVGYLPEERGLYKKMTVRDVLRFHAQLKGLRDCRRAIDDWLARLDLTRWGDERVDALSKGMAQKVQFIAAVIGEPKLLILDEPFSGLDPVNMEMLKDVVLDLKQQRHHGDLLDARHGRRRADVRHDLHDLPRPERCSTARSARSRQQYGEDTIRVRIDTANGDLDRLPGVVSRERLWAAAGIADRAGDRFAGAARRSCRGGHGSSTLKWRGLRCMTSSCESRGPDRSMRWRPNVRKMTLIARREYRAMVRHQGVHHFLGVDADFHVRGDLHPEVPRRPR